MVGSWATFVSPLAEDDPLLPASPEFHDDDPSSYLLYPPGFGPVADWPADGRNLPMLPGVAPMAADPPGSTRNGADMVFKVGPEEATGDRSGALELLGLSEALSGKVSLVGGGDSGSAEKDGVVEYMVIGGLESSVNGDGDADGGGSEGGRSGVMGSNEDGRGVREAPPPIVAATVKVECADDGDVEANLGNGGSSESESEDSSSSSSFSSSSSSDEESSEGEDSNGDNDGRGGGKGERMNGVGDLEDGEIRDLDAELAMSSDDDEDGGVKGPIRSKNEVEVSPLSDFGGC